MKNDLYYIKKKYGEKMAHLCRKLFPTILEENGKLFSLLKEHFDYNKNLYNDITKNGLEPDFYNYIMSFYKPITKKTDVTNKTPFQLMDEAGYNLYKCETYEDTLKFAKYYKEDEKLCTFRDEDRINNYDIFFAVKKDVDNIRREDFSEPKRQDLYGTSVISIQFAKEYDQVSIKNRYNHTVLDPDATFSNNLNLIIYGLEDSFNKYYNYNVESKPLEIKNYVYVNDKFYRYNIEDNNIYYCSNNVIIDNGKVIKFDPSRYLVFETFILDVKEKSITTYPEKLPSESFINTIPKIKNVEILNLNNKKKIIINKEIEIDIDSNSNIIGYKNNIVKNIDDNFLSHNREMQYLEMNSVETIKDDFLKRNKMISEISLKNVEYIGNGFLKLNKSLSEISLPKLKEAGSDFLMDDFIIKNVNLPNLESVDKNFILSGYSLEKISFPNLVYADSGFIRQNRNIKEVYMPKLEYTGSEFLLCNDYLEKVIFPNLREVGSNFIGCNKMIKTCIMPNLESVCDSFLSFNESLELLYLPQLECTGSYFLYNSKIKYLILPNLKYAFENFMGNNKDIEYAYLPQLENIDECFSSIDNIKTLIKRK